MDMGLKGKRVLVTGGSRGVGRAITLAFAQEGADVAFSYAGNTAAAEETRAAAEGLPAGAGCAVPLQSDLARSGAAEALYADAKLALGGVDVLVNNAAVWLAGQAVDIPLGDWQRTMTVNMESPFLLCRSLVRDLLAEGRGGKIINVTSQAAFMGSTTGHSHYAASKAALVAFTVSLAREVARNGINVNALALGLVETDMLAAALKTNREYYENRVPLGRLAAPGDIAGVALFLASRLSDYITGATIDATGGMLMR